MPSESIVDRGHDHYISDVNSARVLIHGGLLSLSDPVTCGLGYILCVHTGLWSPFFNTSSWAVSKNTDIDKPIEYSIDATENDEDSCASKAITENDDGVRVNTAITTPSSVAFAHTTGSNSTSFSVIALLARLSSSFSIASIEYSTGLSRSVFFDTADNEVLKNGDHKPVCTHKI